MFLVKKKMSKRKNDSKTTEPPQKKNNIMYSDSEFLKSKIIVGDKST